MTREEISKGLEKIAEFFKARADMAVGDAKMLLLNWVRCAQEAAELIAAQKEEGERETTSSVSGEAAATFPRGEGSGEAQGPRVMTLEEVKALQPDTDIWIEVRYLNAPIRIRACTVSGFSPGGTRLFIIGGAHNYPMDMYNNYFRCWTSRPTDEQREATAWINQ